jgi:ubiquinone/menaquinone biosynthesis C-methylase UbiE
MNSYFYEVFENIPRQGPGTNESTRKAYQIISRHLPVHPVILDVGCGKGVQTIELARISKGDITALDNHTCFLDCLKKAAAYEGLTGQIRCMQQDMAVMQFDRAFFDLIWSEGAVFIIGIREGLKNWKKFLKQKGFLVLSDLVWLTGERPAPLTECWEKEGLSVLAIDEVIEEAQRLGYSCIDHFTLPAAGWTEEYYEPQKRVIAALHNKYPDCGEAIETFRALENERDLIVPHLSTIGYEFFLFKND